MNAQSAWPAGRGRDDDRHGDDEAPNRGGGHGSHWRDRWGRGTVDSGIVDRLDALPGADEPILARHPGHRERTPPSPPLALTPLVACDPDTDPRVLWHIAREVPRLRRWLVANPSADAELLEYLSQAGGPGVREALELLLDSMEPETPRKPLSP